MPEINVGSLNIGTFAPIEKRVEIEKYIVKNKMNIFFIQESQLKPQHVVLVNKYSCIRDDTGVGTLVIFNDKFKAEQIRIREIKNINCTIVKITSKKQKPFYAISIYIPCNSPRSSIKHELDLLLTKIDCSPFIIGGDLNTGTIYQNNEITE